ncbi:MAG: hypothetical protein AAFU77_16535 [Myxococcota bacterium]
MDRLRASVGAEETSMIAKPEFPLALPDASHWSVAPVHHVLGLDPIEVELVLAELAIKEIAGDDSSPA